MPSLFSGKLNDIKNATYSTRHDEMKRLYLNIIYHFIKPGSIDIRLFDFCIERMLSLDEVPSYQALFMKIAFCQCINEKN